MSLLTQSRLYAGHDSGITHLAAMLGTPTLAFFRSTSVIQWRPLGPKVRIVHGEDCGPGVLEEALAMAEELVRGAD
jgi:heptosyltransferase-3